jgi:TonB-linked SusC/RagA family outer membrane protein
MRQFLKDWLRLMLLALFAFAGNAGMAQTGTVTGKVTSSKDNLSVPGATVSVKNSNKKAVTDADGNYKIAGTQPADVLVFTSIGYAAKEMAASTAVNSVINVKLDESNTTINEVVVVGYGTQKRRDVTGSVVSVDKKRLDDLPNTNLAQALQGSVPGISVVQGNGGAEGSNVSIQIRGQKSISASTDPLLVLDGFVYDGNISDINPSDIETIDILKDASAVAIYGSRGSNGVLLITTKKGTNGKPVITYDGFYGTQKISNLPRLLTPTEFYDFKRIREPATPITATEQAVYDSQNYPNWVKLATRTGARNQQSIGVKGGSEASKYYISTTYLDVKGVAVNDNFKRLTTRANFETNLTKWLTYGTNTQLSYDDRSGANPTFSGDYGAYRFNPLTRAFNADGSLTIYPWAEDTFFANPLAPTLADDLDKTYKILSSNYLNIQLPLKGLSYRINAGVEYSSRIHDTYYGRNTRTGLQNNGSTNNNSGLNQNMLVENILNYNRTFGKHTIAFTGLYF